MDHCDCYAESTDANAGKLWQGADCSLMTCPKGVSWSSPVLKADGVTLDDAAGHAQNAECSDGGICDRATGSAPALPATKVALASVPFAPTTAPATELAAATKILPLTSRRLSTRSKLANTVPLQEVLLLTTTTSS